jgi:uncharacterized membrane protein (DUF485 family)
MQMQPPEPPAPAPEPAASELDIHSESFLHLLMRRQLKLSIVSALAFLVALLGLPLANYFWPELMATRVFGFTLTWFVLGVLFFPLVWIISYMFIRRSIALERSEVEEVSKQSKSVSQSVSGSEDAQ